MISRISMNLFRRILRLFRLLSRKELSTNLLPSIFPDVLHVLQSLYVRSFHSQGDGSPVVHNSSFQYIFCLDTSDSYDNAAFNNWYSKGLRPGNKMKKFHKDEARISTVMDIGSVHIVSKMWWYELKQVGVPLNDGHLIPQSPLSCRLRRDILHQANGGNCRIFVVKYAEYIFIKKINEMSNDFDTRVASHNMAVQLFKYSVEKPNLRLPGISK
ncbi:hypothetical protein Adt_27635 [Abeliophyllum distichum]|uniref:Uncharacterized protein n=1 Tax=Abeliophyllum distichum TaxID=126358 RepID=A0ABD1RWE4_9LAMI